MNKKLITSAILGFSILFVATTYPSKSETVNIILDGKKSKKKNNVNYTNNIKQEKKGIEPILVNDDNFEEEVEKSDKTVVVNFYASWCGYCKKFSPVFKETSKKYSDKIKFVKVDVDLSPKSSSKYPSNGVPYTFVFKKGMGEKILSGFVPQENLEEVISKIL